MRIYKLTGNEHRKVRDIERGSIFTRRLEYELRTRSGSSADKHRRRRWSTSMTKLNSLDTSVFNKPNKFISNECVNSMMILSYTLGAWSDDLPKLDGPEKGLF